MKTQIFLVLTVALVYSTLAEGFMYRRVLDRISERRQRASESESGLPQGAMGTRLYDALMQLSGSKYLANTFYALGNYINEADKDSSSLKNGERQLTIPRGSDEKRMVIERTIEDLKEAIGTLNEGFNQVLIPGVQNSYSVLQLPAVFLNPEFQSKRRPFLMNVGKLAILGISPKEVLPNGFPALFKILGGLKADIKNLTFEEINNLIPF